MLRKVKFALIFSIMSTQYHAFTYLMGAISLLLLVATQLCKTMLAPRCR